MVERSLSMWEVPGSIPGFSRQFSPYKDELYQLAVSCSGRWPLTCLLALYTFAKSHMHAILKFGSNGQDSNLVILFYLYTLLVFNIEKFPNLPGFEPGIFWSVVRRVIHCATGPARKLAQHYLTIPYLLAIEPLLCFSKATYDTVFPPK